MLSVELMQDWGRESFPWVDLPEWGEDGDIILWLVGTLLDARWLFNTFNDIMDSRWAGLLIALRRRRHRHDSLFGIIIHHHGRW